MTGAVGVALKLCVGSSPFGEWLRVLCVPGKVGIHVCWTLQFVCLGSDYLHVLSCFVLPCGHVVIDCFKLEEFVARPILQFHSCTKEQLFVITNNL